LNTLAGNYGQIQENASSGARANNADYLASQKMIQEQKGKMFSNMLGAVTGVASAFVPGAGGLTSLLGKVGGMFTKPSDTSVPGGGSVTADALSPFYTPQQSDMGVSGTN
jgi:hypothetical protein